MSEPEKTTQTPETVKEPDKTAEETRQLTERLISAERRAAILEEQGRRTAELAARASYEASLNRPAPKDPLDEVLSSEAQMSIGERKAAIDAAIRMRAAAETAASQEETMRQVRAENFANSVNQAFGQLKSRRPDISDSKNAPDFAAAMTKAKMEADMRGEQVTPFEVVSRAESIYDQYKRPNAPPVPHVEGGPRADLNQLPDPTKKPEGPSALEKMYNMKPGVIKELPMGDDWGPISEQYVKDKNAPLFKKGINTDISNIASTAEQS